MHPTWGPNPPQSSSWILWQQRSRVLLTRVGILGDFLPPRGTPAIDWSSKAEQLQPLFDDVEVSIVNLESPVGVGDNPPAPKPGLGASLSSPDEALDYLVALRAHVVGLANNHIYDFGAVGERMTSAAVRRRGMIPIGSGATVAQQPATFVWESTTGARVGFWTCANNTLTAATGSREGVEPATIRRAREALTMLRHGGATCCIALLHAGLEHTDHPDPDDVSLMNGIARSGFDVVAACHSHRISGYSILENGRPSFCFYGLGSVASGVVYSDRERAGLLLVVGLDQSGAVAQVETRPIELDADGWGRPPAPDAAEDIRSRFLGLSRQLESGEYEREFYRDMGKALGRTQLADFVAAFRAAGPAGVAQKLRRLRMKHVRRLFFKLVRRRR